MGAGLIDWLALPWSGATDHTITAWAAWHGRLMVMGWAVLVPLGILAARYFKLWPGQDWPRVLDDKHWWHSHRWLLGIGIAAATCGLLLAWRHAQGASALARWHGMIGWGAMLLGWAQIISAMLRGSKGGPTDPNGMSGDHFDMTPRRVLFEHVHKTGGRAALALAVLAVPLGLAVADAPRWMWIIIGLWWSALALAAIHLQRAGACIDTYQAIWGPDPALPGMARTPIGGGISRRIPTQHEGKPL